MVKKVRNSNARAGRAKSAHEDRGAPLILALGWSRRDVAGVAVGALATIAILLNVLFMQSGSHPAPMFRDAFVPPESAKAAPVRTKPVEVVDSAPALVPRPRPADPALAAPAAKVAAPAGSRMPGEIISDIQRELVRRGYYDGVVDGLYGPKTDAAIRDFEQAAGLKPSTEPSEALLQAMVRSPAKLTKATTGSAAAARPLPGRAEAAVERRAPSKRVIALQRALAEYGYGQIRPSGIIDAETQSAIEKFERERKLPITGQASDRVVRELAAMTGRPLE
ncbi:MAG: peptidoglycan-binding domain-containing protein [Xanthobacteraceae bacterium]